jgi:hypothetical protein
LKVRGGGSHHLPGDAFGLLFVSVSGVAHRQSLLEGEGGFGGRRVRGVRAEQTLHGAIARRALAEERGRSLRRFRTLARRAFKLTRRYRPLFVQR